LISNASDACDKLRFEAIDQPQMLAQDAELAIRIEFDRAARTITVSDNGIGMSRQEAIDHLGTIARSGTREFFGKLSGDQSRDAQLIGQFGVGFYSSFIVADRVTVLTRRAGAPDGEGVRWESEGTGEFTIETVERPTRGTDVILHLRPDPEGATDGETRFSSLLSAWELRNIVRKYSDHVSLPIRMRREEWDKEKSEYVTLDDWETVNQASALWSRPKSEIDDDQYKAFYKHVSHDNADPLAWTHNRVEGRSEYTQLLYIPSKAPFDLWDRQQKHGVKLYVRRVFIMDEASDLLPSYLRFVRGVVDSSDLPLNVSREILQESRDVKAIREGCSRRVLTLLEDLAENQPDKYVQFWTEFGQVLKEGLGEDFSQQEKLSRLLRFASTATDSNDQTVSLDAYLARMKEGQEHIYYVTGDTPAAARNSPHLEVFRKKGIEVLLLTDRVDEWMLSFLSTYQEKPLMSVARGGLDLGKLADEAEKKQAEQVADEFKPLAERIKSSLGERVKDVRISNRLTDSPCCLVSDEGEISGHLERLLKQAGQTAPDRKPILEINPTHPLVSRIRLDDPAFDDWSALLFDQAMLAEGGQLADAPGFVRRMNAMLLAAAQER
jgi:molecular chaperone HtpG